VRWLTRQQPDPTLDLLDVIDASWHVDTEAICPDCLQWIGPHRLRPAQRHRPARARGLPAGFRHRPPPLIAPSSPS